MFVKWTSIGNFHNVRKDILHDRDYQPGLVAYRGKVKLHGTNAAVLIRDDGVVKGQKRSGFVQVGNDNAGFAAWLETTREYWESLVHKDREGGQVTVFGEWCGPGIQKTVALSHLPHKVFAVFAIQIRDNNEDLPEHDGEVIIEPEEIEQFLQSDVERPGDVYVIPWYGEKVHEINWFDAKQEDLDAFNAEVAEVEAECPFAMEFFDVDGIGEGLVYFPVTTSLYDIGTNTIPRPYVSRYLFKAKGEKHSVNKSPRAVQLAPEKVTEISKFVDLVVTEERMRQGVEEACGGEFDKKLLGPFIGWVTKDIHKECQAELEASGLDWKPVSKYVGNKIRMWYIAEASRL